MIGAVDPWFVVAAIVIAVLAGLGFAAGVRAMPAFAFLGLQLYATLSKQISVLFLDTHIVFITESGTTSGPTLAWLRFLLFNLSMFAAAALTIYLWQRHHPSRMVGCAPPDVRHARLATTALSGILGLHALNVVATGKVALPGTGIDRYVYWPDYAVLKFLPGAFGMLMVFMPFVAAILLLSARMHRRTRQQRWSGIILTAYFALMVLYAQRFHGLLVGGALVFGVYAVYRRSYGRTVFPPQMLTWFAVGLILLLGYGVIAFSVRELGQELGGGLALLYRSLVLEGHSYWNSDLASVTHRGQLSDLGNGLEFTMNMVGSPKLVSVYLERGVNFASSLPSTLILIGGFWFAWFGSIVYGALYGAIALILSHCVRYGAVLLAFPASYIFLWIHASYGRGSVEQILDWKFAVMAIAMAFYPRLWRPMTLPCSRGLEREAL